MEKAIPRNNDLRFYTVVLLVALASAALAATGMALKMFILFACAAAGVFIIARPEYGIIIFLASFLLYTPEFLKGTSFLTLNNILGLLFCFLLGLHFMRQKNLWFLKTRQIQLMAALGAVFVISFLLGDKPPFLITEIRITQLPGKEMWDYFTQFAFVIFMMHFIRTSKDVKIIFGLLMFLIGVSAFSAFCFGMGGADDYRAASSFGIMMARNSNHLAFYSLFAIVTLWYWRQEITSQPLKILSLACIVVLIHLTFLTASRNGFLNILFLSTIIMVESGIKPGRIIAILLLVGVIGIMVVYFVPEQNMKRIMALKSDPSQKEASKSMSERVQTVKMGLKIFTDHNVLIGVGPGNHRWMRLLQYDHKRWATHNSYLWAMLSGGIIALMLYLLLFWKTWKDLRWMERQPTTGSSPPRWAVKTIRTAFLLFLLFSVFTEAWLQIMLFLIVGMTLSMKRMFEATAEGRSHDSYRVLHSQRPYGWG